MAGLTDVFRNHVQVIESHSTRYVLSSSLTGDLWIVQLVGESHLYEARLANSDQDNLLSDAHQSTRFETAWRAGEIAINEKSGRSAELIVDPIATYPFKIQLKGKEYETFEVLRNLLLILADATNGKPHTDASPRADERLRQLEDELQAAKRELERIKGMASNVTMDIGPSKRSAPVKRASMAKSLVNPRVKMKVAKGTEFGSDTDDEE
ncbi:hypothetical protein SpCBS45565_g00461 [Spizellomyces sp. 'palustris']|nr:hypothetical protein SpCBS45565_g00461 [Spizellomyces sp. 'palustris']